MKKIATLALLVSILAPLSAIAQTTRVDITCGSALFSENIYTTDQALAFNDRCHAAGGTTQNGLQGSDDKGQYLTVICNNPQACKASTADKATSPSTPAQTPSSGKLTYTPLEPLPGGNTNTYNSLSAYLNLMFNILLSIGAMFAVITLVLGGITIMISEVVDKRTAARRRIQAAFIGLGLLLTCWLILNTINPDLTKFSLLGLDQGVAGASGSGSSSSLSNVPTGAQAQQLQVACRAQGSWCALNPAPGGGFSCDCAPAL